MRYAGASLRVLAGTGLAVACEHVSPNLSPVSSIVSTSVPSVSLSVSGKCARLRAPTPMIASTYTYRPTAHWASRT